MNLIRLKNFALDLNFSPQLFVVGAIWWTEPVTDQGTIYGISLVVLGVSLIFSFGVPYES